MRARRVLVVAVVAGSFVLACSGGSGDSNGSSSVSTTEGFVAQYCDAYSPCCAAAKRPTDGATCRALLSTSTGRAYDAAKGEQCISELRALASNPEFCKNLQTPDVCDGVFPSSSTGTAAPGETCTKDSDCAPSSEGEPDCDTIFTQGSQTKYCQIVIKGKDGSTPCIGTRDGNITSGGSSEKVPKGYICDVADGVRCDGATKACVKLLAVGEACTSSSGCVREAYCDVTSRKCTARLAVDAACTSSDACIDAAYCDTTEKKCKAAIASGEPCQRSDQCESNACVNGKCSGDSSLGIQLLCGGN